MSSRTRSTLHLTMGQETIYLLLTLSIFVAILLAVRTARSEASKAHAEPPIVTLNEADGFSFATGSAEVGPKFERDIVARVVPRVRKIAVDSNARTIEVIGHTDDVPLSGALRAGSNLDRALSPWLANGRGRAPIAFDNIGLGMARAVTVARLLRRGLDASFVIVPMSAGPFLRRDDSISSGGAPEAAADRRRIVIRVRRRQVAS